VKQKAAKKMSKSPKKVTSRNNGATKRADTTGRFVRLKSGSKAAELTERAWKKTYENRGKSKATA
jgi:hypothetical protein